MRQNDAATDRLPMLLPSAQFAPSAHGMHEAWSISYMPAAHASHVAPLAS